MKHNFGTSSMEPGIDGLDTTMNNSTTSVILPTTVEEALQVECGGVVGTRIVLSFSPCPVTVEAVVTDEMFVFIRDMGQQ